MPRITAPYLICVCAPSFIDEKGRRWTDDLWAKDLALHLDYIDDLTIAGPAIRKEPGEKDVCLDDPPFDRIKFVNLPDIRTYGQAIRGLTRLVSVLWGAVRRTRIVHTGYGGWPISEGCLLIPMGRFQKKFTISNLESSFWRSGPGDSIPKRIVGFILERLTRLSVRLANLRLFTSRAYLHQFLPEDAPRAFVLAATWVNEEWILPEDQAESAWDARTGPTRLMYAGRLITEKGVKVLLQAIEEAAAMDCEAEITFIGDGPLRDSCLRAAQTDHGKVSVRVLDPLPYGEPFLSLLKSQDALLVPSISDEQPRLPFDAFSQAVPVIGSSTGGIREIVEPDVTGRLVTPGDPRALAEALVWAGHSRPQLRTMGMTAREKVLGQTHRAMHKKRHQILLQVLPDEWKGPHEESGIAVAPTSHESRRPVQPRST
jgi:glycosyltransferase involved in cell wall biosynthesis